MTAGYDTYFKAVSIDRKPTTQDGGRVGSPQFMLLYPDTVPGVPIGLELLTELDQLIVHQQREISGDVVWETNNRYVIKNSLGQQIYFATEESTACMLQFGGPSRGFIMHIANNFGQEVMRVERVFKCCAGYSCCATPNGCCSMEIRVEAPAGGRTVGFLKQTKSWCTTKFVVQDAEESNILVVQGPRCPFHGICCRTDIEYKILSPDELHQVGVISKQWGGFMRQMSVDTDNFVVSFPKDLDVRVKATLLGSVFLVLNELTVKTVVCYT